MFNYDPFFSTLSSKFDESRPGFLMNTVDINGHV